MAAEKDSKEKKQAGSQPRIKWDGSRMRSTYANVFNVMGAREEVVLLFGTSQSWDSSPQERKVRVTERIIMNPFAAKRMSRLLSEVINNYEEKYGILLEKESFKPEARTFH